MNEPGLRRLVTEVPGPRSRELQERRLRAVAGGVGSVLLQQMVEAEYSGVLFTRDPQASGLCVFGRQYGLMFFQFAQRPIYIQIFIRPQNRSLQLRMPIFGRFI